MVKRVVDQFSDAATHGFEIQIAQKAQRHEIARLATKVVGNDLYQPCHSTVNRTVIRPVRAYNCPFGML